MLWLARAQAIRVAIPRVEDVNKTGEGYISPYDFIVRLEQLTRAGRLSSTYADQMREEAKRNLRSARTKAAAGSPELVVPITDALHGLDAHDPAALKAVAARLFAMEGSHGRAD